MNIINKYFFYFISLSVYGFYFYFLNVYHQEYDSIHFQEIFNKINHNQILYLDYEIWYGPHLIFFLKILNFFNLLNNYTLLFLGFLQNLLIAIYVTKIVNIYHKNDSIIFCTFLISLFCINFNIHSFYWDYYSFLIIVISLFYFLIGKYSVAAIFASLIFFLKQTQGIFGLFLLFLLVIYKIFFKKDYDPIKFIVYLAICLLLNLFLIYLFYDLEQYYLSSIKFIIFYSTSLYGGVFEHFLHLLSRALYIKIDSTYIFSSEFWHHKGMIIFYLTFVLGYQLFLVYFLKNIKEILQTDKFIYYITIFSLSGLLCSFIGRGYYSKIFIIFLLTIEIIYLIGLKYPKFFKKLIYIYTVSSIFLTVYVSLSVITLDENEIIRSKNNKFLNINKSFFNTKNAFDSTNKMNEFLKTQIIPDIFVFGNTSRVPALLNESKILNYDLYFYTSWQPKNKVEFQENLLIQINLKKPTYFIYSKEEYNYFIKNNIYLNNIVSSYDEVYKNDMFVLKKLPQSKK